jgi:hypothetical protein
MKALLKSALLIILSSTVNLFAQNTFEFLRLDTSPRAAALAGSFVAANDDPDVIFYNPAGIKLLDETPVSFSFLKHLLDINSASLSASLDFEGIGRFAGGIKYINYGTFQEADQFGNRNGEFSAGELALMIGYANELAENFLYGANVKFIYSSIADRSSTGLAADLGLQYVIPESNWSFGFSVLNLGGQTSSYYDISEDLPLDVRLGLSKRLEHLPFKFYFSLNKLNESQDSFGDRFQQFTAGGEISLSEAIILRLGYDNEKRKELKIGSSSGIAGFSIGLGINVSDYNIDYAFSSLGSVGALHRFGVSTSF